MDESNFEHINLLLLSFHPLTAIKTYPGIELVNFSEGPSLAALGELGHLAPDDGLLHVKGDLVEDLLDEGQAVLVAEAGGPLHPADGAFPPKSTMSSDPSPPP